MLCANITKFRKTLILESSRVASTFQRNQHNSRRQNQTEYKQSPMSPSNMDTSETTGLTCRMGPGLGGTKAGAHPTRIHLRRKFVQIYGEVHYS